MIVMSNELGKVIVRNHDTSNYSIMSPVNASFIVVPTSYRDLTLGEDKVMHW